MTKNIHKKCVPQNIDRYPLLVDSLTIILHNVIEGIIKGKPVHMSLTYDSIKIVAPRTVDFSVHRIRTHIRKYSITYSSSAISGSYIRLKHPVKCGFFEKSEFICSCRSGYFHFRFNSDGVLEDIISDFYGRTPDFIPQLIKDFPDDNYQPKSELIDEINKNGIIENFEFLNSLDPKPPILIEID